MSSLRQRFTSSLIFSALLATLPRFSSAANVTWQTSSGGLWTDVSNWSSHKLPTSADNVSFPNNSSYTANLQETQSVGNLTLNAAKVSLYLSADGLFGSSALNVAGDFNLTAGHVQLQPTNGYSANLSVGGNLTIGSTGSLTAFSSDGSTTAISGTISNAGVVSDAATTVIAGQVTNTNIWSMGVAAGTPMSATLFDSSFLQNAGTLYLNDNTDLSITGGTFSFAGGTIQGSGTYNPDSSRSTNGGTISLYNSFLYTPIADGGGATINGFRGIGILGNLSANTTLALISNGVYGVATLYASDGTANNGTLIMRTSNNYPGVIQVDDGTSTFTNNGDMIFTDLDNVGTIQMNGLLVNNGHIGAYDSITLSAHTINNGHIDVGSGSSLSILNATFDQNAGTLGNSGSTNLTMNNGTFNFNGGQVLLTVYSYGNSTLKVAVPDGLGAAFNAYSILNLIGNLPPHTTVSNFGNGVYGNAILAVQNNAANNGTINLFADNSYEADIHVANSGVFTNNATLSIHTDDYGSIGFYGAFVNRGTVTDNAAITFYNNVANEASFNISDGGSAYIGDARFNQDAGNLGNDGGVHFVVDHGTFNYNGGVVYATVDLYNNSVLSTPVADGGRAGFNMYATGSLHGDFAANTTLVVVANGAIGSANLYMDQNPTNNGHIYLSVVNGYEDVLNVGDGTGTLRNAGTLTFNTDADSNTLLVGTLVNNGSLFVDGNTYFYGEIYNNGNMTIAAGGTAFITDGQILNQNGFLEVDGTLNLGNGSRIVPGVLCAFNVDGTMAINSAFTVASGNSVSATGSKGNVSIANGLSVGGQIVAQGGGNIEAGGNIVAQGGGNIVAQGGGNIVAQGGGNIVAAGGGNIVAQGGGNIVAQGGGNIVALNGASPAVNAAPASSIIAQANGTITLAGGNLIAANLLEIDAGGTLTGYGTANVSLATSSGNIAPANGTLTLNAPLTFNAGSLGGAGPLIINDTLTLNANLSLAGNLRTSTLTLNSAVLDLAANKLILQPTAAEQPAALAALENELLTTAIFSTLLPPHTALALLDNAALQIPFTTFGGIPTDANSLILSPELLGDANIDGHVDLSDLSTILNNFGASTLNWTNGNFDNAPTIDLTDLADILNNFGLTSPNASITSPSSSTPTPEPTTLLLLAPLASSSAFRRRRTPMCSEAN